MLLNVLLLKQVANYQASVIKLKKILTSFDIKDDDILPITKNLNVNKAHGWDQLLVRMIKTYGDSITFPLKLII